MNGTARRNVCLSLEQRTTSLSPSSVNSNNLHDFSAWQFTDCCYELNSICIVECLSIWLNAYICQLKVTCHPNNYVACVAMSNLRSLMHYSWDENGYMREWKWLFRNKCERFQYWTPIQEITENWNENEVKMGRKLDPKSWIPLSCSRCSISMKLQINMIKAAFWYLYYTVFQKKHVTTFLMISWSRIVRLERFLAHLLGIFIFPPHLFRAATLPWEIVKTCLSFLHALFLCFSVLFLLFYGFSWFK